MLVAHLDGKFEENVEKGSKGSAGIIIQCFGPKVYSKSRDHQHWPLKGNSSSVAIV